MRKEQYFCDKYKIEVAKQEELILIERVPEIVDVYPRGGKGNQIIGAKLETLGYCKQELCQHCYNRYMELYNVQMIQLAVHWKNI